MMLKHLFAVLSSVSVFAWAGHALAQRRVVDPGPQLHTDRPIETTNVATGSGPTSAVGPVGDVRGGGSAAPEGTEITGPIGETDAARVMQTLMPRLRPCYDAARAAHPQLAGRLEVRVALGRGGRVTMASAAGLGEAPEVSSCVADVLRRTQFPEPRGGSLQFFYPLMFAPPAPVHPARPSHPGRPSPAHH